MSSDPFREVNKQYKGTGVFVDFNRQQPETIVRKAKGFKQRNFMPGVEKDQGGSSQGSSSLGFQLDEEEVKQEILKPPSQSETSDAQRHADEMEINILYEEQVGFTKVIEMLAASKKPLIGHNMIMDMGFIFRQFLSETGNLPGTFPDFVKQWKKTFP